MPRNPFHSETRDTVVTLANGVIGKLRFPPTVHARILADKPAHLTLGDFALKEMYDAVLIAQIKAGHYTEVTAALVADGWLPATDVAEPHKRSNGASR